MPPRLEELNHLYALEMNSKPASSDQKTPDLPVGLGVDAEEPPLD